MEHKLSRGGPTKNHLNFEDFAAGRKMKWRTKVFYRDVWRNVIVRRDNEATFECCIPIRVTNLFPKSGGFSIYLCLALIANPPPIQIRQLKFLPSPSRLPLVPGSLHWTSCSYRSTIVLHIQQWVYHHAIMVSTPLLSSSRRRRQIMIKDLSIPLEN